LHRHFSHTPQSPEIFRIDCIRESHQMFHQTAARRLQIQRSQMRGNEAATEQGSFVPYPGAGLEFTTTIGIDAMQSANITVPGLAITHPA